MTLEVALRLCLVALVTGLATALFARVAPRIGWTDAPRAGDASRKCQRRAVPAVGGAALLVGQAARALFDQASATRELAALGRAKAESDQS